MPVGRDGVFEAFTPPYYADMRDAVDAFLEVKWSQYDADIPKSYKAPDPVIRHIQRPDDDTIERVKDYCQYVHDTYGRFPAYIDPMYQRLTCQAQHVDLDFYEEHYPPGACTPPAPRALPPLASRPCRPDGRPPRGPGPRIRRAARNARRAHLAGGYTLAAVSMFHWPFCTTLSSWLRTSIS